jgi:hypothetical protein
MNFRDVFCHRPRVLVAFALVVLGACSQANFSQKPVEATGVVPGPAEPPICNPFGSGGGTNRNGLVGSIYYASGGTAPTYPSTTGYFQYGRRKNGALYLSDLNVPTRLFNTGFSYQSGQYLTNDQGAMLIEDFALSMTSNVRLTTGDQPGYYEFAVISDDGSKLSVSQNGTTSVMVNNDTVTPPRMGCANGRSVYFDGNTTLPIKLDYFQGPRFHIAMVLMWKYLGSNPSTANDPKCGATDSNQWFNENTSAQGPWYAEIQSRGWKPLKPMNFWLEGTNPCQ